MVLAERGGGGGGGAGGGGGGAGAGGVGAGSHDAARNGRRSRGPSPNGRATPDSSSEEENPEKIRVGRDYQAVCPELEPAERRQPDLIADRALLVWSPTPDIADNRLDEYITVAKEKFGYNGEQALGMLFWHKHDLDRAVLDLANFTPFPDEWTFEDKVLFEQAFAFHGKKFHRIRQMLPDKSIASLVKYYYSWKKTRARSSQMDRTTASQKRDGSPDRASDRASDDRESDADEKQKWTIHRGIRRGSGSPPPSSLSSRPGTGDAPHPTGAQVGQGSGEGWCTACGILCNKTMPHNAHKLCNACHAHARRTGSLRPVCGPVSRRGGPKQARFKHKLPRGIYINHDDLVAMASESASSSALNSQADEGNNINNNGIILHQQQPLNQGDLMLKVMDREIVSLKRQVQTNKQQISALKRKNSDSVEELRPGEVTSKINSRWSPDELLLAVQGVRKYGKDFQAIAETIGTKNETHLRTFWASYRRRYNLDAVLREWEAEKNGGGSGPSSSTSLSTASGTTNETQDMNNGHSNANGEKSNEPGNSSSTGAAVGLGKNNSPAAAKDDKMEVDSEGCALGSIAEQGGAPTTPSKPSSKSAK